MEIRPENRNKMKIVFVYEHFFAPFDEGVKNLAYQLHRCYDNEHDVTLVRYYKSLPNALNSALIVPRIIVKLLLQRPDKLIFIPQAALTFSSLLKLSVLQLIYRDRLVAVGVQKRQLKSWQQAILRWLPKPRAFVLSRAMAEPLKNINMHADVITVGIDRDAYQPPADKTRLREKYSVPPDKRVLLHVGHIKSSRNIRWLLEIKQALPELEVILIGSTATQQDAVLGEELERVGVRVLRDYLPNIHEIYQLADVYCFPVTLETAAMETPLSVLEAMATNLPIITTPFGRLPEQFENDSSYRYVSAVADVINILESGFGHPCENRAKTERYTWRSTAEQVLAG